MIVGIDRLVQDLSEMGFKNISTRNDVNGISYAVIPDFMIPAGSHAGRVIDLAIPVPADYPRGVGASMHVKAEPHLFPFGNIPNVRNVVNSGLGAEWQYWSYQFQVRPTNPTVELISQINEIFRKN